MARGISTRPRPGRTGGPALAFVGLPVLLVGNTRLLPRQKTPPAVHRYSPTVIKPDTREIRLEANDAVATPSQIAVTVLPGATVVA